MHREEFQLPDELELKLMRLADFLCVSKAAVIRMALALLWEKFSDDLARKYTGKTTG